MSKVSQPVTEEIKSTDSSIIDFIKPIDETIGACFFKVLNLIHNFEVMDKI